MKKEPLIRVLFTEGVNFPGDDAKNPYKFDGIDSVFPKKGAVGSTRAPHRAYFAEGFVILEHPASKNQCRYPMHRVKELVFEADQPAAVKA